MWKEEIEQDFIQLKKAFTKGGIQAFPDFGVGDPFIGEHVPSLTGFVGEKLYVDLVSISKTIRGKQYMLTAEDSSNVFVWRNLTRRKEVHTVVEVLMDQHFYFYCMLDQLQSDQGKEFVYNLWRELFSEFKIQHTTTLPYNP